MLKRLGIHQLFFTNKVFILPVVAAFLYALSFKFKFLFTIGHIVLLTFGFILFLDILFCFVFKHPIQASREVPKKIDLAENCTIKLHVKNRTQFKWFLEIIDELPQEFEIRDNSISLSIKSTVNRRVEYVLNPKTRGKYLFGDINIYIKTFIGMASRKIVVPHEQEVKVYPSVAQMKKYELYALPSLAKFYGVKKHRRLGHSYEFEQIKGYVSGDDIRTINWKATARFQKLMVNQYEEEKSQAVYSVIDKSRAMRMPFNDLMLVDYAVNSSLVISNIALNKKDRAGVITFSDKVGGVLKADNRPGQIIKVLESLYSQSYRTTEADYELLYLLLRKTLNQRSLIFLYTNFESIYALKRVLPVLRKINKNHVLVVMSFENSEINEFAFEESKNTKEVYSRTAAREYMNDKRKIAAELSEFGIRNILSRPEDLSINTVNKYLELKSRGVV